MNFSNSNDESIKLNLCCGKKRFSGYVNVDMAKTEATDLVHDVRQPLPYSPESVDEIICFHGFEHFQRWESEAILADWVSKLKPGGLLVLELPCLDKVLSLFFHHMQKKQPVGPWVVWGLFGDPSHKDPAMMHHWCYSTSELRTLMQVAGLQVTVKEPMTHVPVRDMRLEGRKSAIVV